MKVYLGDLVHTWEKSSTWTFPLNIGFIAAYARKIFGDTVEIRLFKRPEMLIDAIKSSPPDLLGLSFYVWNKNLNKLVFEIAKNARDRTLCVAGGPSFTALNNTKNHAMEFFREVSGCDAYIPNQGERGFSALTGEYLDCGGDVFSLRSRSVPGCTIKGMGGGEVNMGEALDPITDLDEIPSPYLSGLLDAFFDEPFAPVLETNRSCPYRCTFCAWGIGTDKLTKFSEGRILSEIDYIGQRCKNAIQLFIADANFGILDRDAVFARALAQSNKKFGFPGHLAVQWNKSRPDRIFAVARELKSIARVGASMQSLKRETLTAVKRKNLPLSAVKKMLEDLRSDGSEMPLFTELILGLPEETRESHIAANKSMIDEGAEVVNYNLHLLPGTELETLESRAKYFRETGWRLMDNAFGVYDGKKVFEGQEVVLATSTMARHELRGFRFFHFLLQFMWGGRWYFDYLHFLGAQGMHIVDLIDRLSTRCSADSGQIGDVYRAFAEDHALESFGSYGQMRDYWSASDPFQRLRDGDYGKLNYTYSYRILLEAGEAFDELLLDFARTIYSDLDRAPMPQGDFIKCCQDILRFGRAHRLQFTNHLDVVRERWLDCEWDILGWRNKSHAGTPRKRDSEQLFKYRFTLPQRQQEKLLTLINQYRSHNVNLTLRKMTEYIKPQDLFYDVCYAENTECQPNQV